MNNDAQVHILEVIIVIGLLLVSLYFAKSFDFSPHSVISKENRLETLGNGMLASLEGTIDPSEEYNNLLARFVYMNGSGVFEFANDFTDYVNDSIPEGTLYDISVVNISKMSKYSDETVASSTKKIYSSADVKIGTEAYSSRIVVIDGYVYEVVLSMCFILR